MTALYDTTSALDYELNMYDFHDTRVMDLGIDVKTSKRASHKPTSLALLLMLRSIAQ